MTTTHTLYCLTHTIFTLAVCRAFGIVKFDTLLDDTACRVTGETGGRAAAAQHKGGWGAGRP